MKTRLGSDTLEDILTIQATHRLMTFKRPISILTTENNETMKRTKNTPEPSHCLVCGDEARIVNYGALSCFSCKTFFRRNGFHPKVCNFEQFQ